jgi:chaperone required for assembly of F1-ATPase
MLTKGKAQPPERPKRFYAAAGVGASGEAFNVLLDGRPVRTPGGVKLELPTAALAQLVAAEWGLQGEHILMAEMPLTRWAFTAVDRAPSAREDAAAQIARYAGSDVLCYFAESPAPLAERELAHWGPVLDWADRELHLPLERAVGVIHRPQPEETLERARELALALDNFALTGLANASGLYASAVLAFAVQRGELSGEAAFDLSRLDEAFQEEKWGVDAEAAARTAGLRRQAIALERWFRALS